MPRVYRVMTRDNDRPRIGNTARCLGVRVPVDIKPDQEGNVSPKTGGMSVAPTWRDLPSHRIPARMSNIITDAVGKNSDACWRMGDGPFAESLLTKELTLAVDRPTHGFVEPVAVTSLEQYQQALADTQDDWIIDEE